jgi:hypothetical protein
VELNDTSHYPQLAKMQEVQPTSQAIGEFLDWLGEQRIDLCSVIAGTGHDRWAPIVDGHEKLLARYFEIDLNAVERERRDLLAHASKAKPNTVREPDRPALERAKEQRHG